METVFHVCGVRFFCGFLAHKLRLSARFFVILQPNSKLRKNDRRNDSAGAGKLLRE